MSQQHNNATYTHRPVDSKTGKPSTTAAIVEWVPFSQPNKDINSEKLASGVDRRIDDKTFGASAIMKGIDDTATYANAQVSKQVFAINVV